MNVHVREEWFGVGGGSRGISPNSVPSAKGAKYKGKGLLGEMTGGQTGAARTR